MCIKKHNENIIVNLNFGTLINLIKLSIKISFSSQEIKFDLVFLNIQH